MREDERRPRSWQVAFLLMRTCIPAFARLLLASWLPASGQAQEDGEGAALELTLDDAIRLALQNNRDLLDARLARTIQEFALDVAEDRYRPRAAFSPVVRAARERDTTAELAAVTGLRIETGGQFSLRFSEPVAGQDDADGSVSLSFSQPLLRGFGIDIDTAPLRIARLGDRIGVLAFRETVAGVVVSTINAWRNLVRARRQLEIGEASLDRAREQLETNRTLIEAGQMAAREILQSEADVADRELALVQTRNGVTTANFGLIGRQNELARQALRLAEEKLVIERSKLQQGLSSIFQLARFEDDLVRAQNAEVDALVDYENALTALDRTLGTTLETWGIVVEQVGR